MSLSSRSAPSRSDGTSPSQSGRATGSTRSEKTSSSSTLQVPSSAGDDSSLRSSPRDRAEQPLHARLLAAAQRAPAGRGDSESPSLSTPLSPRPPTEVSPRPAAAPVPPLQLPAGGEGSRRSTLTSSCPVWPPSSRRIRHVDEVLSETSSLALLPVSPVSELSDCWSEHAELWPQTPPPPPPPPPPPMTGEGRDGGRHHLHQLSSKLSLLEACRRPAEMSPEFAAVFAALDGAAQRDPGPAELRAEFCGDAGRPQRPRRSVTLRRPAAPHRPPDPAAARFSGPKERRKNALLRRVNGSSAFFEYRDPERCDEFQVTGPTFNELADRPLDPAGTVFDWFELSERLKTCELWVETRTHRL
ncbi:hypothetical protein FJT64_024859 [Amphibalanus amphitrite]|uniref:Uncharacterized protein n=1 Tax=Amphibalanus amphitrite TaxID=1232801 RepID=A0A6A4W707_AMPAM|nr:hypothetical protein FJT64_024859 [Amphibalanus amphitrite]